jgi:energy-coupling factor transport system substrate-specific component
VIAANVMVSGGHGYYFASLVIITLSMLPFFIAFEGRKPQARELVVIAVLVALTVTARAAFFMTPQFKPVVALVVISGAALGAHSGFMVGALSGFVSNFIFGQGPWTPWQMFAFGMIGFVSGLIFSRLAASIGAPSRDGSVFSTESAPASSHGKSPDAAPANADAASPATAEWQGKWYDASRFGWNVRARRRVERLRVAVLCAFGFIITFVLYGIFLDTAAVAIFSSNVSKEALLAIYISGAPFNFVHAVSTTFFLAILARTMIEKLERVKKKYGLLTPGEAGA